MTYALAPDVHATLVDADLVLLDLRTDRYACLPQVADALTLDPATRRLAIGDPLLAADLEATGLLGPAAAAPTIAPKAALPPAGRSALEDAAEVLRPGDLPDLAWSVLDVARRYRGQPLRALIQAVRAAPDAPPALSEALLAHCRDVHRWVPYAPLSAKCLLRSFLLLRQLQRRGLTAAWVFGVRTWPFHAHCWLQVEDMVLDDRAERVRAFTPILVV